ILTRSPAIQPPPPKPTGAPGAPDQDVSSSQGFGSSTLNSGLAFAPLSAPTRLSSTAPDAAFWGMCTGPAPHKLPYSSAFKMVGSAVPPIDTWTCSLGPDPRALTCTETPGGPAHGLNSTVGLSRVTCISRRSSAALA